MKNISFAVAATALLVLSGMCCIVSPAGAISADLAKKCRNMAIKAHPPPPSLGNKAYAQAEREFFQKCISANGQIPENEVPK